MIAFPNPGEFELGLTRTDGAKPGGYYLRRLSGPYDSQMSLHIINGYSFGCCGAGELSSLSGIFKTDKDVQETALALYNFFSGGSSTFYMIAATYQMEEVENSKISTVLGLLMEIGAKEVHKTPNRNHGPNNMHMLVLDPHNLNRDAVEKKYFCRHPKNGLLLPKYVKTLSETEQQALADQWQKSIDGTIERNKQDVIQKREELWKTRINTTASVFTTIKQDAEYVAYYARQNYSKKYTPQVSEQMKESFYNILRRNGWSNSNEQQQSSVPKNAAVGPAVDSIWQAATTVQKW